MDEVKNLNSELNEDLGSPAAPEIATSDEDISLYQMFQQANLPSLGRQIFPVVEINGPTAGMFNIKQKTALDANGNKVFEVVRRDINVYNSQSINTGLTQEVIQDIKSQFGKSSYEIIGKLVRGIANDDENTKTLAFLEAQSVAGGNLTLTDPTNAEMNLFQITQKVHELVLKINSVSGRSYNAFAVIPYARLAGIVGLKQYAGDDDEFEERGLFVTKQGLTSFYVNPDAADATAYVGIVDYMPSKSSGVFSPYTSDIVEAVDPDSGEMTYHLYNRYAITASPLHETGKEMFYKFEIL